MIKFLTLELLTGLLLSRLFFGVSSLFVDYSITETLLPAFISINLGFLAAFPLSLWGQQWLEDPLKKKRRNLVYSMCCMWVLLFFFTPALSTTARFYVCGDTYNCWNGIIPGTTTFDEAITRVDGIFVKIRTYENQGRQSLYWITGKIPKGGEDGSIQFDAESIVEEVVVRYLPGELTLDDVISRFGEPNSVNRYVKYPEFGVEFKLYTDSSQSVWQLRITTLEEFENSAWQEYGWQQQIDWEQDNWKNDIIQFLRQNEN